MTAASDRAPASPQGAPRRATWLSGLLVAVLGAAIGWGVHALVPAIPWLTASLVIGMLAGCVPPLRPVLDGALKPGLGIAARRVLRLGIVVLGLQLSLVDIARLGWVAILAIVALVLVSFAITYGIARALRLPGDEPVLLAAGFSICGVSAIGAMSAARRSPADDSAAPTALVTLYGTLAIVVLPLVAGALHPTALRLSPTDYGRFVGASVHDVGQVVATAGAAGSAVLAVAVVVKLTRVLMLAPMVAIASVRTRMRSRTASAGDASAADQAAVSGQASVVNQAAVASRASVAGRAAVAGGARPPIVPLFIIGFLALVLVRTLVRPPEGIVIAASDIQSALLAIALAAIGANLRLERLARSGLRSIGAGALSWAAILVLSLGVVVLSR